MTVQLNLKLYEGNGVPIGKRGETLPEYTPLTGADDPECYVAEPGLRHAVNVALALGQPLLVTGEPGTGKTQLAASIAFELGLPEPLKFFTKTTSTATDLFYQYDALQRFQDIQTENAWPAEDYITYQALGLAVLLAMDPAEARYHLRRDHRGIGPTRSVVLIDEIDKAPRDLPNDILNEIETMTFEVRETKTKFKAEPRFRPILVLTSNSEKNLPDAFLRRCVFYHIAFPEDDQLKDILKRRFGDQPGYDETFINAAVAHFREIRKLDLKKPPATAELLAWLEILRSLKIDDPDRPGAGGAEMMALSYSVLAKTKDDLARLRTRALGEGNG